MLPHHGECRGCRGQGHRGSRGHHQTPFPIDIWIGVADSYVYEVDIHGPATADEPKGTWRSIVLSKHDVYVEIKAPI